MPQTLAVPLLVLFKTVGIPLTMTTMAIAEGVVMAGISTGLSLVSRAFRTAPPMARGTTVTAAQPTGSRRMIYGEVGEVPGDIIFQHSTGETTWNTTMKWLHQVVVLADHSVESITGPYFDGELIPIDGNGNATGKFAGVVKHYVKLGGSGVGAFPQLAAMAPDKWGANHRLDGMACAYLAIAYDPEKFQGGFPKLTWKVKGKNDILDPRTGLRGWTDNAILCARDYFAYKDGLKIPAADLNDTVNAAEANICDEAVALAGGGTEKRYTTNTIIDLVRNRGDIVRQLLSACAGTAVWSSGKWSLRAAHWTGVVGSITDDDLAGPVEATFRLSRTEACNGVKGLYFAESNKWQLSDFPAVTAAGAQITAMDRTGWTATASSVFGAEYAAINAINGAGTAFWASAIGAGPHWIDVDMKSPRYFTRIDYTPRQDGLRDGDILRYEVYASLDGVTWGAAIAGGTLTSSAATKTILLPATLARYVRLVAYTTHNVNAASIGELSFFTADDPYLVEDGGVRTFLDVELPCTTSSPRAQRLARIELETRRRQITAKITTKLTKYAFQAGDVIQFTHARFGWTNKTFNITESRFVLLDGEGDTPVLGMEFTLRETDQYVYEWLTVKQKSDQVAVTNTMQKVFHPIESISLAPSTAINTTNFARVDSVDAGATATIRVYGAVGGVGTTWTRQVGARMDPFAFPAASLTGCSYTTAYNVLYDPVAAIYRVYTDAQFSQTIADHLIWVGRATTVAAGGTGGSSGGGGTGGGTGGGGGRYALTE